MKTISAFTETAIDNPYVDVVRLLEITIGSLTLYLCDRIFGDDDLCTFNGQLYEPLVLSWNDISMGRINPVTYEVEPGVAGFTIDNSVPVGGVDCFSELFVANDPQYCPVLISEIHEGATAAEDKEDIFKGGIEDLPGMTVEQVTVSCTGYELTIANKFDHTIVDDTTYPGADPDDLGKMVPQIYGKVKRSPCISADVGGVTTLSQAMLANVPGDGGTLLVSDASAFPSSGAFTAQSDGEQIRFASRSGNTLTLAASGARGYNETTASAHAAGAPIAEVQAAYVYLIADHPIKACEDLYVDQIRQRTGEIPDIQTALLLNFGGADASTTFTDSGFYEHTVTAYGNAQIDTAQKVFDTGSGLFDGVGDYLSVPIHAIWDFLDNSAVFDLRLRFNTVPSAIIGIFQIHFDGNTRINLYHDGVNNKLTVYGLTDSSLLEVAWTPVADTWYHIAITKIGTTTSLYIDGVLKGSASVYYLLNYIDTPVEIGRSYGSDAYGSIYYFDGWIDAFRITNGKSRWGAAFTPPTEAYPYWGDVGGLVADVKIYTGQSGDEYSGYSGKAVVVFQLMPKLEKQVNLSIADIGHDHGGDTGYADVKLEGNSSAETVIGKSVSVDVQGNLDDGSGTYTGTPSALIERPDHICKHIIIVRCGLTASEINTASYTAAGTFFNTNSYVLGFSILSRPNVRLLLGRIAAQSKALQFWGAGQHHIVPLDDSPVMDKAIDDHRIDLGQVWLKYTDRINIKNSLTASYARHWSGYDNEVEANRAVVIASDSGSIAIFGTLQGDSFSFAYITEAGSAQAQDVIDGKLADLEAARLIAGFAGGYYLSDIERGDIIRFDNAETISESITTGYLMTLAGDNLVTLSGDKLIWWLSEAAEGDEFLKKALISLVTMGTTLFRVIDKTYRPDSTIQLEAITV